MKFGLICALLAAAPALAATPDAAEQTRAVAAIRNYALDYIRSLPDFTCLQVTTRTTWPNMRRRLEVQHAAIEEQITYVNRRETYSVQRINGRPVTGVSHDDLLGISSRGEFGTPRTIIVPYEGLVFADPETGVVYRIEMHCEIPKDSEYKQLDLTLDLRPADVSGREFVLPRTFICIR